ncbi:MAG: hypothetical protein OXN17_17580 [Candidatus Poribacteria bacterium]|nr:hypothetical protein [Candidatus Poribacteria bacterium]MDE0505728.1 hypothetical protein [Candidatus Poribacteria bacterium]
MRKYCIVSLLLLGMGFDVSAHNVPSYYSNNESHTPTTDFHRWVVNNDEDNLHWHFGDGEAGGWSPCVAAAYNEATDSYGLLPDGNCGEFSTNRGNYGNNVNSNNNNDNNDINSLNSLNDNSEINEFSDINGDNDNNGNNGNNGNDVNNDGNSGGNNDGNNGGNNDGNNGGNNGGSDGNGGNGGNAGNGNQGRSTGGASGSGGSAVLCEDGKGYSAPEESNHWPTATVVVSEEEDDDEEDGDDSESDSTTPPDPIKKTSGESSDSTAYLTFTMIFPKGVNSLHLPFKPYTAFYFTDLFELLENENVNSIAALRPTVQLWSIISSSPSVHDEWISRYRGFLIDMEETVEVTFIRDAFNYGYDMMYLKDGMNLIGVPRNSDDLAVVSDFFVVFDCVAWVEVMIDGDTQIRYHPALESTQLESTLDSDTEISATQGYMVMSLDDDEYPVWGDPWGERIEPMADDQGTSEE